MYQNKEGVWIYTKKERRNRRLRKELLKTTNAYTDNPKYRVYFSEKDSRITHDPYYYSKDKEEAERIRQKTILKRRNIVFYTAEDNNTCDIYVKNMLYLRKRKRVKERIDEIIEKYNHSPFKTDKLYRRAKNEIEYYKSLLKKESVYGYMGKVIYYSDLIKENNLDMNSLEEQKRGLKLLSKMCINFLKPEFKTYEKTYKDENNPNKKIVEQVFLDVVKDNLMIVGALSSDEREWLLQEIYKELQTEWLRCHYSVVILGNEKKGILPSPQEGWNQAIAMDLKGKVKNQITYKEGLF